MNSTDVLVCILLAIVFTPLVGFLVFLGMLVFAILVPRR